MKLYDGGIVIVIVLTLLAIGAYRETKPVVDNYVQDQCQIVVDNKHQINKEK